MNFSGEKETENMEVMHCGGEKPDMQRNVAGAGEILGKFDRCQWKLLQ